MKLYITTAGIYAGTQKEAGKGHTQVEVPTDKYGLIHYLNKLVHAKATDEEAFSEARVEQVKETPFMQSQPDYTHQSVSWDAHFDAMPLAQQLHYAARAMENARDRL